VMTATDGGGGRTPVDLPLGHRMRLYLLDLSRRSARILAIAISAPEDRFEQVPEAAAPIVDSFESAPADGDAVLVGRCSVRAMAARLYHVRGRASAAARAHGMRGRRDR
jgi:hypothetical protein